MMSALETVAASPMMGAPCYAAPFQALDQQVSLDASEASYVKHLQHDDPIFAGHYPHFAIFPGVLVFEAFAQAIRHFAEKNGQPLLRVNRIKSLRFLKSLHPGDTYKVTVKQIKTHADSSIEFSAQCESNGQAIASATLFAETQPVPIAIEVAELDASAQYLSVQENLLQLQTVLPQRFPMLLVDRALQLQPGKSVVAQKNVSLNEPSYRFCRNVQQAQDLAYPAALIIESFSQAVGLLLGSVWDMESAKTENFVAFGAFQEIAVHGFAYPGDCIVHRVTLDFSNANSAMFCGHSFVNGVPILSYKRLIAVMLPNVSGAQA